MSEPVESITVTWALVSVEQILGAIDGQRITGGCADCGGDACFRLTDMGWKVFCEHKLNCPTLRRVKAEVGGAG